MTNEPITREQLLAAATEFTFRPDYGPIAAEFDDDPAERDAVVLSWRGPADKGGDPDRWAIKWRHLECWSRSKREFVYEPGGGKRGTGFIADTRFGLDEAVALVPGLLRRLEEMRIPQLERQAASWAEKEGGDV